MMTTIADVTCVCKKTDEVTDYVAAETGELIIYDKSCHMPAVQV